MSRKNSPKRNKTKRNKLTSIKSVLEVKEMFDSRITELGDKLLEEFLKNNYYNDSI